MANYGAEITKGTTSTSVGIASLEAPASSMRRIKLYDVWLGSDAGTLGTSDFRFEFTRSTTASTGTSVTPSLLDLADVACVALVKTNLTVEGTTAGLIPKAVAMSEQNTVRWVANPGSELVIPAVASAGIILRTPVVGNTVGFAGTFEFSE